MKKTVTVLFLVFWALALCLPLAARHILVPAGLVSYAPFNSKGENREPARRPSTRRSSPRKVPWANLGRGYEAWYNDAFPWRTELLKIHRRISFEWLKTPVGREVPGHGKWVFRRGGDWAELDDYLGAFELTGGELADWITLFEGRREWAHAIGSAFLTMPAPVKAQVRWQEMYPALRGHRGHNVAAQIRKALAKSPAKDDVVFANDDFETAFASGREVFFDSDHHPSAYGLWLLYDRLNRRLAELFPGRVSARLPWYDSPPGSVRDGLDPGCWADGEGNMGDAESAIRIAVSMPGESIWSNAVPRKSRRYPYCNVATRRAENGVSILMAHDSYMRYSLSSWRGKEEDVRFPFSKGVGSVRALIFYRFSPDSLASFTEKDIPDVIIEQFPECRLDGSAHKYLDDNTRAAAVFGRAVEPSAGSAPRPGDRVVARVVLDGLHANGRGNPVAVLKCGNAELARRKIAPGVRRAVFFDTVEMPAETDGGLSVSIASGIADRTNIAWRAVGPDNL